MKVSYKDICHSFALGPTNPPLQTLSVTHIRTGLRVGHAPILPHIAHTFLMPSLRSILRCCFRSASKASSDTSDRLLMPATVTPPSNSAKRVFVAPSTRTRAALVLVAGRLAAAVGCSAAAGLATAASALSPPTRALLPGGRAGPCK